MEKQKNIPELRFPIFNGEWERKKLKEVAKFFSGGTPLTSKRHYFDGEIPFIRSGEINSNYTEQFITEDGLKNSSAKMVKTGDVLYALYGATSGEVAISKISGAINQAILCIRSTEDHYYIYSYLELKKENIIKSFLQGGQGNLSAEIIKNLTISLPTLPEQQRIASFFTAIDQKITQFKQKKNQLEQYKKGVMQKIFNQGIRFKDDDGKEFPKWEKKTLKIIAKIYDGTHQTPNYNKTGIPFYSVEHVTANDFQNTKFISEDVFEKENLRVKLEKGDILMTRIGDIGTARYIDWDVNASFYVSLALIKQSNSFNSKYLAHYIATQYFQMELWERTIHVAFPKKINLGEIGNCEVLLPVLPEQTKIANFLSAIDNKINHTQMQIEKAEVWKKGLLQQMFV